MAHSEYIFDYQRERIGILYDVGSPITVGDDNTWMCCADDNDRVQLAELYLSERANIFMMAVSEAHKLVRCAIQDGDDSVLLRNSIHELVEALRLDWEACYIAEAAEREAAKVVELLDEEEATPFVVKKGERYLNFDDEGRFATIRTIKEVTEDNEYCLVRICSARVLHLPDSEQEAWFELQSTEEFRDLRKLV